MICDENWTKFVNIVQSFYQTGHCFKYLSSVQPTLDKKPQVCPVCNQHRTKSLKFVQCSDNTGQKVLSLSNIQPTLDKIQIFCPVCKAQPDLAHPHTQKDHPFIIGWSFFLFHLAGLF